VWCLRSQTLTRRAIGKRCEGALGVRAGFTSTGLPLPELLPGPVSLVGLSNLPISHASRALYGSMTHRLLIFFL
jgi:hypothetical protein